MPKSQFSACVAVHIGLMTIGMAALSTEIVFVLYKHPQVARGVALSLTSHWRQYASPDSHGRHKVGGIGAAATKVAIVGKGRKRSGACTTSVRRSQRLRCSSTGKAAVKNDTVFHLMITEY
jgi:hypothetical protein